MRALGAVVLAVLLTACTSEADRPTGEAPPEEPSAATPTASSALPTQAERLWSAPLRAMGPPVPAGDSLVVVVQARGDELDIVSLDGESGEVQWREPFRATPNTAGVWLGHLVYTSAAGDPYVVHQLPAKGAGVADRPTPYVARDPGTGEVVARTRPLRTAFGATRCADGHDVCLRVGPETFDDTRWVLGSWELRREPELPAGAGTLGPEGPVYAVRGSDRGYSAITALGRAGPDGWRRPATAYLEGEAWHLTANTGWYDEESGVAVVAATHEVPQGALDRYQAGEPVALDQSTRRTLGIDGSTGRLLWQRDGADFRCLELTSPGVRVRCAVEGEVVHREGREEPRTRRISMSLEGFDPGTGEPTWSYELAPRVAARVVLDQDELDARVDRILDGETAMVLPGRDGWSVVSLTDGETRAVTDDEAVLCLATVPFTYALDVPGESVFDEERERRVAEPCGVDGRTSRRPLGAAGLLAGGVDLGDGVRAVALADRVEAYRLS